MSRKIVVALVATVILVSVHFVDAQQPAKVPRIGYLSAASASSEASWLEAFREGLRELGYIDGKYIAIEPAKALGLTIPRSVLTRADRVIE